MKRAIGITEAAFDLIYLCLGVFVIFLMLLQAKFLAAATSATLILGDSFHLIPRVALIITGQQAPLRVWLGRGKQITSVTMTLFYILLWQWANGAFGRVPAGWSFLFYLLGFLRIVLCCLHQNQWTSLHPCAQWAVIRNVPFFMMGLMAVVRFWIQRSVMGIAGWLWLVVFLSFACYVPVILFSRRHPKIGALMLPKTCMYLLILLILLFTPA